MESSTSFDSTDLEAGFSGNTVSYPTFSSYPREETNGFDHHHHHHHHHHFLHACFLCKKLLPRNGDIFMYRGDTPFCSEECRQEQIEMDEAEENSRNKKSLRGFSRKEQRQTSQRITVRAW